MNVLHAAFEQQRGVGNVWGVEGKRVHRGLRRMAHSKENAIDETLDSLVNCLTENPRNSATPSCTAVFVTRLVLAT